MVNDQSGHEDEFRRLFQKPDEIPNWQEVLGERYPSRRLFVIPKEPRVVQSIVAQAVFKTLTGRDLIEYERRILGAAAPTEGLELKLLDLMEEDRLEREAGGFSREVEEALAQGKVAARANLDDWQPWNKGYDYWERTVRIGQTLSLRKSMSQTNFLLLSAPVAEIGENVGFPEVLVGREWGVDQEDLEKDPGRNPEEEMLEVLEKLGFSRKETRQGILDSEIENQFLSTIGFDRVDKILAQANQPNTQADYLAFHQKRFELMYLVFNNLSDEEKAKVTNERKTGILRSLSRILENGSTKAEVSINVQMLGAIVGYNPETRRMEGNLSRGRWYHISYEFRPEVTPETRHDALLAIRKKGVQLADEAGLQYT